MKIYVPTKAIVDRLFIALGKEDGKLYLTFMNYARTLETLVVRLMVYFCLQKI